MASKALLFALGAVLVVSAYVIIVSSGEQPRDFECKEKDCPIPIRQKLPFLDLEVANKVTVKPGGKIIWTLNTSIFGNTHFHPNRGIEFKSPGFKCKRDDKNDLVYECTNDAASGEHKYTIFTVGFGSKDKDPFVVNN